MVTTENNNGYSDNIDTEAMHMKFTNGVTQFHSLTCHDMLKCTHKAKGIRRLSANNTGLKSEN